jgi:hypothetical protein
MLPAVIPAFAGMTAIRLKIRFVIRFAMHKKANNFTEL